MRTLLIVGVFVSLAACSEKNPYYCPGLPDDNCRNDGGDIPMGCTTAAECTNAAKPICDTTQKLCVACTADDVGSCSGTTPVCSTTNMCTACTDDDQCDSGVCLVDGSCALVSQVAFVSATGDDANACSRDLPCKTINANAPKKPFIKVISDLDEAVLLNGVSVTIVGDAGVAVRRTTSGPVFDLRGTSAITIRDLTIREGLSSTGHGVLVSNGEPVNLTLDRVNVLGNTGTGIVVQGGTLTMSRTVVAANNAGGANVATQFSISNSIFVNNGSGSSTFGGLFLTPSGNVTFRFNTVANNTSPNAQKGINCTLAMTASSTIISGNDVGANCAFEYSLFDGGVSVAGSNYAGDPKFKNTNVANPRAADFYRILPTSDAVNKADPASTMNTDIDGDARPQGSADIGADEVP